MRFLTITIAALTLQACTLHQKGTITPTRAQVQERTFHQKTPLAQVSPIYLEGLALHHDKYGDGPVNLTLIYDYQKGGAMQASNKAADIASTLQIHGIRNTKIDILPVRGEEALIVTYAYYTAHGPKDCTTMPGYANTDISAQSDYRMGCTVETLIARQVARPKDLLGQENPNPTTDGRSAANLVNAVRAGTLNQPINGQQASK